MPQEVRINLPIPAEVHRRLKAEAALLGTTLETVIRAHLARAVGLEPPPREPKRATEAIRTSGGVAS